MKDELRIKFKKVHDLSAFMTERITIPSKGRGEIRIEKFVRAAYSMNVMDRYGKYDDAQALKIIEQDRLHVMKEIFIIIEVELIERGRLDLVLSKLESDNIQNDYYAIYQYCYKCARKLGIFVPHDRNYRSVIINDEGAEIADKIIREEMADK